MNNFYNNFNKNNFKNFTKELCDLSPTEFVTLGCVSAILLTQFLDPNEQNTLGNFLEMIGQILLTSYAQSTVVNPNYISFSIAQANEFKKEIINLLKNKNIYK